MSLINLLGYLRSAFGGWESYVQRYCNAYQTNWGWNISGAKHLTELNRILIGKAVSPHGDGVPRVMMIRRTKSEILDLPPKTRQILRVRPDPKYLEFYSKCERALSKEVSNDPGLLRAANFEFLSRIREAVGFTKIKEAIEYIRAAGEPLVVFAHHVEVQLALVKEFPHALVIVAKTKNRQAIVDEFQKGASDLLITSPRVGGAGITLTAASRVLFVEFDFTAAAHCQAEDRVHRIGQTRPVRIDYLYAEGTIDGFLLSLINRKARIFGQLADGLSDPDWLVRLQKPKIGKRRVRAK